MSEHRDRNGVVWSIKQGGRAFAATIAASSPSSYINRGAPLDSDELDVPNARADVTWPTGGEPTIIVQPLFDAAPALTAKDLEPTLGIFADLHKADAVARSPAAPPANTGRGNVGLILIVVGGLWALSKMRRRRG